MKKVIYTILSIIIAFTLIGNTVNADPPGAATPSPTLTATDNAYSFAQGDVSLQIVALQERLFSLNYFNIHVTGVYGTFSQEAVKTFQAVNDLRANGDATQETVNALYANTALPYTKGIPAPPSAHITLPDDIFAMPQANADALVSVGQSIPVVDLYTKTTLNMVKQSSGANWKMTCSGEADIDYAKKYMSYPWQKRPVMMNLDGRPVLACLEYPQRKAFEISETFSLYFIDSVSDMFGLPDAAVSKMFSQLIIKN